MSQRKRYSIALVDVVAVGSPPKKMKVDGETSGSSGAFKRLADAVTQQMKEIVVENKKAMPRFAAQWNEQEYYNIVVTSLFASWLATPNGKVSVKRATRALKDKLHNETISDFIFESKHTCKLLQARDSNSKAQEALKLKLQKVVEVAGSHLVPSLPGMGFIDILNTISEANESVLKEFREEELVAIQAEAEDLSTADGSLWVEFFAKDLSKYLKRKKN